MMRNISIIPIGALFGAGLALNPGLAAAPGNFAGASGPPPPAAGNEGPGRAEGHLAPGPPRRRGPCANTALAADRGDRSPSATSPSRASTRLAISGCAWLDSICRGRAGRARKGKPPPPPRRHLRRARGCRTSHPAALQPIVRASGPNTVEP